MSIILRFNIVDLDIKNNKKKDNERIIDDESGTNIHWIENGSNILKKWTKTYFTRNELGKWPTSTNIKCWHCTLYFKNTPIGLPYEIFTIKKETFTRTKGCFCSFSCAKAYNYNFENNWEKNLTFLYELYRKNYTGYIIKAPPKTLMIQYGGHLTKKQYKKYLNRKKIILSMPPLISLAPIFNIINECKMIRKKKSFY
jgi:hypothetical protein